MSQEGADSDHSSARRDDERWSTQAAGALTESSSAGSSTQSLSRRHSSRRPITRRLAHDIQVSQQSQVGTVSSTEDILNWDDTQVNRFMGLTPPPLPPAMLPYKKRTLKQVLDKDYPPRKDKMSEELDGLVHETKSPEYVLVSGPFSPQTGESSRTAEANQHKETKMTEASLTPRFLPPDMPSGYNLNINLDRRDESPDEGQAPLIQHTGQGGYNCSASR
ncbi:Uu.00g018230.m01.CDS01 [Anthostomella pinea]|uniref:Uu.00g018230.m01.CDS01 n=1 Tax=Anthostomella pinea TaxID=933095 RepID=A0AAI8VZ15_9PEZI|nr:Uu.00g018230.m01.CDS01 [Anthostomella pinea]